MLGLTAHTRSIRFTSPNVASPLVTATAVVTGTAIWICVLQWNLYAFAYFHFCCLLSAHAADLLADAAYPLADAACAWADAAFSSANAAGPMAAAANP